MSKEYKKIQKKIENGDDITTDEYLEVLRHDRPEYYEIISRLMCDWETMDEDEFEKMSKKIEPQDWEIVQSTMLDDIDF